ncbi:hypothetical protein F528_1380 [Neisseria meningitidis 992008]|uniref:Uncharacterized protein n=3 Tax=Neisseria meningitidis TaxID=487 RepID=X5FB17_NEIME|nr:hypothetical protein NMA510612_2164 [Neisseria meningitidis]KER39600.1 hypothetical protein F528_1380 [Neisseria meningitidis 992008]CBA03554.1 hypothetical protein predicted by Glimmer/Critica [Neisseria meningitidis alpha153]
MCFVKMFQTALLQMPSEKGLRMGGLSAFSCSRSILPGNL